MRELAQALVAPPRPSYTRCTPRAHHSAVLLLSDTCHAASMGRAVPAAPALPGTSAPQVYMLASSSQHKDSYSRGHDTVQGVPPTDGFATGLASFLRKYARSHFEGCVAQHQPSQPSQRLNLTQLASTEAACRASPFDGRAELERVMESALVGEETWVGLPPLQPAPLARSPAADWLARCTGYWTCQLAWAWWKLQHSMAALAHLLQHEQPVPGAATLHLAATANADWSARGVPLL